MRTLNRNDLLIVNKNILAIRGNDERKTLIEAGEIIQFRYEAYAHFRTLKDDEYFHVDKDTFIESTEIIGKIWGKVVFGNIANLKDIFNLQLFDWYGDFNCLSSIYEKYPSFKKLNKPEAGNGKKNN